MRRHDPTIERLGNLPLFAACTTAELTLIASKFSEHHATAGEVLIRQGDVGREFVVIVRGSAHVMIDDRMIARIGAGDFVGEIALLDRRRRTATVVAETDVVAEVCTTAELIELVSDAPNMTRKLLAALAARLRDASVELAS